eukprot:gene131-8536_t
MIGHKLHILKKAREVNDAHCWTHYRVSPQHLSNWRKDEATWKDCVRKEPSYALRYRMKGGGGKPSIPDLETR